MQAEKLEWSAEINDDRIALRLGGTLSRDTLLPLWQAFTQRQQRFAFLSQTPITQDIDWDLAQLRRIDSAGFALFCEMISHCRKAQAANKTLRIQQAPPQLLTLAELFNLDDWLNPFMQ